MSIKIRIVSDFDKKGLTEAERALNGLSKAAGLALAAVGAAVAGIAVKSVQEFAKFDAALTKSKPSWVTSPRRWKRTCPTLLVR
jgi:hypothetical protein